MKVSLLFFAGGVLIALAGCTGLDPDRYLHNLQRFMLSQGNPPAYVAGYTDGCSAGRRLGGDKHFIYRKNNTRFEKDALYARGWQEGQINCRNEALEEEQRNLKPLSLRKAKTNNTSNMQISEVNDERKLSEADKAAEAEMREIWEELRK